MYFHALSVLSFQPWSHWGFRNGITWTPSPKFKRVSLKETREFPFWGLNICVENNISLQKYWYSQNCLTPFVKPSRTLGDDMLAARCLMLNSYLIDNFSVHLTTNIGDVKLSTNVVYGRNGLWLEESHRGRGLKRVQVVRIKYRVEFRNPSVWILSVPFSLKGSSKCTNHVKVYKFYAVEYIKYSMFLRLFISI